MKDEMRLEATAITRKTREETRLNVTVIGIHIIREQWGGGGNPDYESRFFARFDEGVRGSEEGCLGRSGSLGDLGQVSRNHA